MIVVTNNATFVDALQEDKDCVAVRLEKQFGETAIEGGNALDQYGWKWPTR